MQNPKFVGKFARKPNTHMGYLMSESIAADTAVMWIGRVKMFF